MNPHDNAEFETNPGQGIETVFYEPHTIPAGWDLSEYLPAYTPPAEANNFGIEED
jgi:hypothetical protein